MAVISIEMMKEACKSIKDGIVTSGDEKAHVNEDAYSVAIGRTEQ